MESRPAGLDRRNRGGPPPEKEIRPMVWQGKYDRLFIDGTWVPPATSDKISVISPFSEQLVAQVPDASTADADRAVAAARVAFDHGPWPRMTLQERMEVVRRV